MKNLVWAIGALIVIIIGIFILTSQNQSGDDTIIPSPIPFTSPSPELMINDSTKSADELPFPLLGESDIQGKKIRLSTEKGDIVFELFSDSLLSSSNFINLVSKKFYDGLKFHRREEGFVIQGGDPKGDGTGGPGYRFTNEPVTRDYNRGIVAMANAGPDTNGSQFFIMLGDAPQLPKQYTIFGSVIEGMDIVDQIEVGDIIKKAAVE